MLYLVQNHVEESMHGGTVEHLEQVFICRVAFARHLVRRPKSILPFVQPRSVHAVETKIIIACQSYLIR